jgi:iron complex transport system permease protein
VEPAASLGLNVPLMQWLILSIAVILCGASVALAGIVGFVGLIAPYFARRLFGSDQRWQLCSCAGIGGMLVLLADLAARTVAPGQELPLGTLLSLIGAPFFLWLILKQKGDLI